jgi:hypothetical protein
MIVRKGETFGVMHKKPPCHAYLHMTGDQFLQSVRKDNPSMVVDAPPVEAAPAKPNRKQRRSMARAKRRQRLG